MISSLHANGGRDRSRPPLRPGQAEGRRRVCDRHRPGAAHLRSGENAGHEGQGGFPLDDIASIIC